MLLAAAARLLRDGGTPFALIGAAAMAVHGVSRSTLDLDLLVTDARCLDAASWHGIGSLDVTVDARRGDQSDPLAGVVRLRAPEEAPVDVVVGRFRWQAALVERAVPAEVEGEMIPVARRDDLILLKLFAGGPQDAWDIAQLLDTEERDAVVAGVDARIGELPDDARALWVRIGHAV
jgi:hypothetical protein